MSEGSTLERTMPPNPYPTPAHHGIVHAAEGRGIPCRCVQVPLVASVAAAARPKPPQILPQPSLQRGGRAVRWHYTSLCAAFATGAIVSGLLIAAELLNNEALWSALAYCTV